MVGDRPKIGRSPKEVKKLELALASLEELVGELRARVDQSKDSPEEVALVLAYSKNGRGLSGYQGRRSVVEALLRELVESVFPREPEMGSEYGLAARA